MDRAAALALLRRNHEFPGEYEFRVVVRPATTTAVVTAIVASSMEMRLLDVTERKSRLGNYVALHVKVRVSEAEVVLDVYETLRNIEGVLATM